VTQLLELLVPRGVEGGRKREIKKGGYEYREGMTVRE